MMGSADNELLDEFARTQSEEAFAALVDRHVNLVYSTAIRFTGNPHHAQEIAQAVFIILVRKAAGISPRVVLSGWLYQTTRLTAANFLKGERRRQQREQEAYMQSRLSETDAAAWEQIAPLLDEAMGRLGEAERAAVVLRYFENKSAAEIAAALGSTEAAVHKRIGRAVEKLRRAFKRQGVSLPASVITGAVAVGSVQAAPVGLANSISVVALAKGAAAGGSTLALVKGALEIMAWTKAKTIGVAAAFVLLAAGTTMVMVTTGVTGSMAFRSESMKRLSDAKQAALACILFAADHQEQLPGDLEEVRPFLHADVTSSEWELTWVGKLSTTSNPVTTVLLREKASRQSPDGQFYRAYAFADGHVELLRCADGDFEALEQQRGLVVHSAEE